ncbi:hypothetical protein Q5752_004076 [Cryptotrichosporon argae]
MPDLELLARAPAQQNGHAVVKKQAEWSVPISLLAAPPPAGMRATLARITGTQPSTSLPVINLGLGDPTLYPLHPPPPAATEALARAAEEGRNGYLFGSGMPEAREAVAAYHKRWDGVEYDVEDIVLTHGVSHALDMVLSVLVPPGSDSSVLVPRPGFGLYSALLGTLGTEIRYYDCVEQRGWEVDLEDMEAMVDVGTRCIILTNPSNPCGSNYAPSFLHAVIALAERHRLPIIADEIYGHMTFSAPFVPLASLSTSVPVLTLSGLSKRFLLPGRRFGWVALHDPAGRAGAVRAGLHTWANRFFGPSSVDQHALPAILLDTPDSWFADVVKKVQRNAEITYDVVIATPGLSCVRPEGALYVFVKIDMTRFPAFGGDDTAWCAALYKEEAVFLMPGALFGTPGYVRIVIGVPQDLMREVGARVARFCARYYQV